MTQQLWSDYQEILKKEASKGEEEECVIIEREDTEREELILTPEERKFIEGN
jgi:hypothetical protein